jgi:hypothetical protein
MATKWQKKGVGVSLRRGSSQKKPVTNEDDGTRAGYHVERWDDSQDAVVQPTTLKIKRRVTGEE